MRNCFFTTNHILRVLSLLSIYFLVFSFFSSNAIAAVSQFDTSLGVAYNVPLIDKEAKDGAIVSYDKSGYHVSKNSYDSSMVGIVTENPAVVFKIEGDKNVFPIVSSGNVFVLVNTKNGEIKKGDPITSSDTAGVGMKALQSGYVVGSALEDFKPSRADEVGKILLNLNIHFYNLRSNAQRGLLDIFNLTAISVYEQPTVVFRYFLSGLLVVISFVIGFYSFGRIAGRGIEAIGRNPLASRMIQFGIFLNVLITIAIIVAGFAMAYFVLKI